MTDSVSIAIKGAGVAGLWSALLLNDAGYKITIYDIQSEALEKSCSYRAGGMIAPFCEAQNADPIITELGVKSIKIWQKYFPDNISVNGSLLLAPPQDINQIEHFKATTQNYDIISTDKINQLEPALEGRYSQGLFYPHEAHIEPRIMLKKMIKTLKEKGVNFAFNTKKESFTEDIIIDTTGLWAKDTLPLRGVKGEMIIIRTKDITLYRPVRLLHIRHPLYIVPRKDSIFMIGATTIETQSTTPSMSLRSAGELLTQAYQLHPIFAEAEILEMNVGLRPAFIDNNPEIKKIDNHYYINGLYRHGWTVSPALAEQLCAQIKGNK